MRKYIYYFTQKELSASQSVNKPFLAVVNQLLSLAKITFSSDIPYTPSLCMRMCC